MDLSAYPVPALFALTVVVAITTSTLNAHFAKNNEGGVRALFFRNSLFSFFIAITLFVLSGFVVKVSVYTLILALLFGGVTTASNLTTLQAYKYGPYGYTSVIIVSSTVITALSGFLFWGEPFGVFKIFGIILMLLCFFCAIENKKDETKKANLIWFIYAVASMLLSASIGILQKTHQSSEYKGELMGFLVLAFVFSTVLYFAIYFAMRKKGEKWFTVSGKKPFANLLLLSAVAGIGSALNNWINLYLSGVVDSAIMFPIVNGIPLMGGIIISFLFFKEKLSKKQMLGLVIGVLSIVLLCI